MSERLISIYEQLRQSTTIAHFQFMPRVFYLALDPQSQLPTTAASCGDQFEKYRREPTIATGYPIRSSREHWEAGLHEKPRTGTGWDSAKSPDLRHSGSWVALCPGFIPSSECLCTNRFTGWCTNLTPVSISGTNPILWDSSLNTSEYAKVHFEELKPHRPCVQRTSYDLRLHFDSWSAKELISQFRKLPKSPPPLSLRINLDGDEINIRRGWKRERQNLGYERTRGHPTFNTRAQTTSTR